MWWNILSIAGDAEMISIRNDLAEKMTPAQLAEAQRMAREWFDRHGE